MSEVPSELKFTKSHEWIRDNSDGTVTVGITDHAQELLGDLVFVEVPEVGANLDAEQAAAVVESVKAASDVYAPVAGEVVEVNEGLSDAPETINQSPYTDGWIFKLRLADSGQMAGLMDAEAYTAQVESES